MLQSDPFDNMFLFPIDTKTFKANHNFLCVLELLSGVNTGRLGPSPLVFTVIWRSIHPGCAVRFVLTPNMRQKG